MTCTYYRSFWLHLYRWHRNVQKVLVKLVTFWTKQLAVANKQHSRIPSNWDQAEQTMLLHHQAALTLLSLKDTGHYCTYPVYYGERSSSEGLYFNTAFHLLSILFLIGLQIARIKLNHALRIMSSRM